jgi:hypothetical protein
MLHAYTDEKEFFMKIQFSLVHPDLVSTPMDVSAIAGIVQTDQVIDDYTVVPFAFHPDGSDGVVVAKHDSSQSLLDRNAWRENITTNSFHHLLAMEIWKGVNSSQPAGEVAFVKTTFPDTPEGQSTYVIFGLIKGDRQKLAAMSERIFESTVDPVQPMGQWNLMKTASTGIQVEHVRGEQILDGLKQPLWGFGATKYGMTSDISIETFKDFEENTRFTIEHGKGKPGTFQSHPDPKYLQYIRQLDAEDLVPIAHWQSTEQNKVRDRASDRIMRAIVNGDYLDTPARRSKHADAGDEPSL